MVPQRMSVAESASFEARQLASSVEDSVRPRRRLAFITNFCAHYSVGTFEILAARHDVSFYFFSVGDEWYWQQEHGVRAGRFKHRYLPGFRLGRTRVTPTLPFELMRRPYDAYVKSIHGRFALPATYLVARLKRRPFVLWTGIWFRVGTWAHRLAFPLTRFIYRHSDAIVVYGEHVKRYLVKEGVSPERVFVSTHAVDNASYGKPIPVEVRDTLRAELGILPDAHVILYLGRLEHVKGLEILIRAFSQLGDLNAVLVLAGEGSEGAGLRALAKELGVAERCRFAGYVPVERTPAFYAVSSVLVLPSVSTPEVIELWGLVVNEAFNQGLPAVVTDAVGAAAGGMVQDGVNGFVVPQRNPEALARALGTIVRDPALRDRMSRAALETVSQWTQDRMASAFDAAVEFALRGR
jgi:glycosyltransferase involved in cell wall biosynthesis